MNSGVYKIVNELNGKSYIGSSVNVSNRCGQHFRFLKKGKHPNRHLQRAFIKHGCENFSFHKIVDCRPENILKWEQIAIDGLKPEYNICPFANNTAGRKFSEETKDKIRQKAIGRKMPVRTEEHRKNLSRSLSGKPKSEEHMKAFHIGRKNQIYTVERKQKISESIKNQYETGKRNRKKSSEHCAKIGKFFAALSDEQVRELRNLRESGKSISFLSEKFGLSKGTICDIAKYKKYKWVK